MVNSIRFSVVRIGRILESKGRNFEVTTEECGLGSIFMYSVNVFMLHVGNFEI